MDKSKILRNARFAVLGLLVIVVIVTLYMFRAVILPFAVAAFVAYLIAPVIGKIATLRIAGRKIPRGVAILIVYSVALGLTTLMGFFLVPKLTTEVNRLVQDLPKILRNLEASVIVPLDETVNVWLAGFVSLPEPELQPEQEAREDKTTSQAREAQNGGPGQSNIDLIRLVEDYTYELHRLDEDRFEIIPRKRRPRNGEDVAKSWDMSRQITNVFGQFRSQFEDNFLELLKLSQRYTVVVLNSLFMVFLVLMTSVFILIDPKRLVNFLRSMVPRRHHDNFDEFIRKLDHGLSGVVRGQVLICAINGSLTGIGIAVMGLPFVFTLTFIATILSLIPIFGVLLSTVPIILIALTVSYGTAVVVLGWILVIHFIEGNFLNPKILGDSSRIHPVLIIFALVAGQYLAGIMGALVAVPVFSLFQNSFLFIKGIAEKVESTA